MKLRIGKLIVALGMGIAGGLAGVSAATAAVVAFEWTEGGPGNGTNSTHQSRHGTQGPVLADDFVPAISGTVSRVDWWGSAATNANWEITFHTDAGGVPFPTPGFGGISQHFVNAAGADPDGDQVFAFTSVWTPSDIFVQAGTTYWFSVANFNFGWLWANPGPPAPTVGTEQFTGVVSVGVGPNGGPHFGPWNAVATPVGTKQDFAFRIWVVPEPGPLALVGAGLAVLMVMAHGRTFRQFA